MHNEYFRHCCHEFIAMEGAFVESMEKTFIQTNAFSHFLACQSCTNLVKHKGPSGT